MIPSSVKKGIRVKSERRIQNKIIKTKREIALKVEQLLTPATALPIIPPAVVASQIIQHQTVTTINNQTANVITNDTNDYSIKIFNNYYMIGNVEIPKSKVHLYDPGNFDNITNIRRIFPAFQFPICRLCYDCITQDVFMAIFNPHNPEETFIKLMQILGNDKGNNNFRYAENNKNRLYYISVDSQNRMLIRNNQINDSVDAIRTGLIDVHFKLLNKYKHLMEPKTFKLHDDYLNDHDNEIEFNNHITTLYIAYLIDMEAKNYNIVKLHEQLMSNLYKIVEDNLQTKKDVNIQ
jgi:hypothetical protein